MLYVAHTMRCRWKTWNHLKKKRALERFMIKKSTAMRYRAVGRCRRNKCASVRRGAFGRHVRNICISACCTAPSTDQPIFFVFLHQSFDLSSHEPDSGVLQTTQSSIIHFTVRSPSGHSSWSLLSQSRASSFQFPASSLQFSKKVTSGRALGL